MDQYPALQLLGCTLCTVLGGPLVSDVTGASRSGAYHWPKAACFLLAYTAILIGWRAAQTGAHSLYEGIWACNQAMVLAAVGMLTSRPVLVAAAVAAVAGDQVSWYIDVLGYLASGRTKFPIGVAKYLTYPENQALSKQITSSHHVWFLPLCVTTIVSSAAADGGASGGAILPLHGFWLSCAFTSCLAIWARAFTPKAMKDPADPEGKRAVYLNINGAYEFWQDIKVDFLHALDNRHPALYLPYLFVTGNLSVNLVPYLLLGAISSLFSGRLGVVELAPYVVLIAAFMLIATRKNS